MAERQIDLDSLAPGHINGVAAIVTGQDNACRRLRRGDDRAAWAAIRAPLALRGGRGRSNSPAPGWRAGCGVRAARREDKDEYQHQAAHKRQRPAAFCAPAISRHHVQLLYLSLYEKNLIRQAKHLRIGKTLLSGQKFLTEHVLLSFTTNQREAEKFFGADSYNPSGAP